MPGALLPIVARVARGTRGPPREVVRRYVEEFKNAQRFSVFARCFGPDFRHHFGYDGDTGGMTSWVRTGQDFLGGFPDVRVTLHALVAEGDYVVEVNTARGTHRGRFRRGPQASHRVLAWNEIHVYRLRGDRIVENWPEVDVDALVARIAEEHA